jgi:hypothetical protein
VELADVSEVVTERLEEEIEVRDHCDLGCPSSRRSSRILALSPFSSRCSHWS